MLKGIAAGSYWAGVAGVGVSIAWRLLTLAGILPKALVETSHALTYHTLLQGAVVLLVVTIATTSYRVWQQ